LEPTTTQTRRPAAGRARGSVRAPAAAAARDAEFDLLTAALIGVAIGVGTTLLLRSGPSGASPAVVLARGAGRMGRHALPRRRGRGEKMARLVKEQVAGYASAAREQVDELAAEELAALRRAIRRRRKQLGL
jgi:hypothetical protein